MTLETYLAYLVTCAVFFATPPGPSQILMISHSAAHGMRRSLPTIAGDLSANALQMIAAGFGLASILATSAFALTVVKWAGVAYLLWMAWRTFRAPPPDLGCKGGAGIAGREFAKRGFLTSASNPKAVFFFAALFPQFIDPAYAIWPQLLILGVTYLVIDGVILVLYGMIAERAFTRLKGAMQRHVNRIAGVMMALAAALLAFKDIEARATR